MAEETARTPALPGFIEKNLPRLKHFTHIAYMFSRIPVFWMAVINGGYYILAAAYFHDHEGIPNVYLWVGAILFLDNGLLKMAQRFIELNGLSNKNLERIIYDPEEPWWHRVMFRLVIWRRGMIKRVVIMAEFGTVILLGLVLHARMLNEGLYAWSGAFPYFLKPMSWNEWTLPENIWLWLAIVVAAGVLALINTTVFLVKSPHVRRVISESFREFPHVHHPLAFVFQKAVELLQAKEGAPEAHGPCTKNETAAKLAELVVMTHVNGVNGELNATQRQTLIAELTTMICGGMESGKLEEFLTRRIAELKQAPVVEPGLTTGQASREEKDNNKDGWPE